jgi:hypothetical protein
MSRRGPTEGVVLPGKGSAAKEVLIRGARALNRCMHGDTVARLPFASSTSAPYITATMKNSFLAFHAEGGVNHTVACRSAATVTVL